MKCAQPMCKRDAAPGEHLCRWHELHYANSAPVDYDYEAARIDPTTDRDQWDVFGEDGAA